MTARAPKEPRAFVGNADDPAQVADGERRERMLASVEDNDIRVIMALREGRRFCWRFMAWAGLYETPWGEDDRSTSRRIGKGDAGRYLLERIERATPEGSLLMQREAMEDAQKDG